MPILEVGETLAATGYVDEAFPGPSLQPGDVAGRTAMRTWMGVCGDYLFRQVVRGIPRDRTPSEEEMSVAREALGRAESILGDQGRFLVGDALSLADLYLAPQLANCREKAPELVAEMPRLTRIETRPSFTATEPD
jgi:glutathione S-transferase